MRVICPHCQTIYQLQTADIDAVLVCHRCGTEFGLGEKPDGAQDVDSSSVSDAQTLDIFAAHASVEAIEEEDAAGQIEHASDSAPGAEDEPAPLIIPARETWDGNGDDEIPEPSVSASTNEPAEEEEAKDDVFASGPPPRRKARIVPWLLAVVLLIAGTGFWINHEAWLDNPWLRSVLINLGMGMDIRDKDWHIDPESVSATWLERRGGQTVLVITGDVHNRLQTDLPPPLIHFTLYARDNPDETILERDLIITRPPLMQTIRQAPYSPPPRDDTPIAALGKRGFILVLEDLPQNAGNFSLLAKAR